MARLMPALSLLLFSLTAYGVGAFSALEFDPTEWPEWLRLLTSTGAIAAWMVDVRQGVES